jgi:flagellar biosynthesis protein FlhB
MSEGGDDDKQHEPSQKRLDEARKRGEIPKSTDLTTAAAYGGLLAISLAGGTALVQRFGQLGLVLLEQPDRLAPQFFGQAAAPSGSLLFQFGGSVLPFFAAPAAAVLLALIFQRALHFAPEKLAWKFSRLSPIGTARQKFGREGLFEFGKSLVKLIAVSVVLASFLSVNLESILGGIVLAPVQLVAAMFRLQTGFLALVALVTLVFGCLDYIWQRSRHIARNRMSRKEMMDEAKESDGDPHVKMQRRQRGQEIATNRMLQDVAKADVVIVNPTHYAVALKWNRKGRGAPSCTAKGVDAVAARIREKAMEAGVPLHSDPPTARALYATVKIGQQIQPEHYRAVAAAIRFAEAMSKRRKKMPR